MSRISDRIFLCSITLYKKVIHKLYFLGKIQNADARTQDEVVVEGGDRLVVAMVRCCSHSSTSSTTTPLREDSRSRGRNRSSACPPHPRGPRRHHPVHHPLGPHHLLSHPHGLEGGEPYQSATWSLVGVGGVGEEAILRRRRGAAPGRRRPTGGGGAQAVVGGPGGTRRTRRGRPGRRG